MYFISYIFYMYLILILIKCNICINSLYCSLSKLNTLIKLQSLFNQKNEFIFLI